MVLNLITDDALGSDKQQTQQNSYKQPQKFNNKKTVLANVVVAISLTFILSVTPYYLGNSIRAFIVFVFTGYKAYCNVFIKCGALGKWAGFEDDFTFIV